MSAWGSLASLAVSVSSRSGRDSIKSYKNKNKRQENSILRNNIQCLSLDPHMYVYVYPP